LRAVQTQSLLQNLFLLLVLLSLITPTTAHTFYDDSEDCHLVGDTDIYGIGFRIGYYLQWVAVLLVTLIAPDEAAMARTASNIFTLAIYINTYQGAAQDNDLVTVEGLIIFWIVVFLSMFNIPFTRNQLKRSACSIGIMLLLQSSIMLAQPWLVFKILFLNHSILTPGHELVLPTNCVLQLYRNLNFINAQVTIIPDLTRPSSTRQSHQNHNPNPHQPKESKTADGLPSRTTGVFLRVRFWADIS
jgi:hypothetical protein